MSDVIVLYLVVGLLHVCVRFVVDGGALRENRLDMRSHVYVLSGTRLSPETLMGLQILVGILLWPIGLVQWLMRVFGR